MKNIFSQIADKAISILTEKGFNAFLVGGFIRQSIIGEGVSDIDICTDALPNDIISVFSSYKIIKTGIRHGTVTVILDDTPIEITTFRIDGEYEKNRKPKQVMFSSSLIEDLKRRDFTMNAIAYNSITGFCDPFDGVNDINKKIIRCVGNADTRFQEDALRILRALRFSSTLGFDMEEKTAEAIFTNYPLLKNISKERITSEILKLFEGKNLKATLFKFSEIFTFLFGNDKLYNDITDDDDVEVKIARLKKTDCLALPSSTLKMIKNIKQSTLSDRLSLLHLMAMYGDKCAYFAIKYHKKYSLMREYEYITENNICRNLSMLSVNGDDLISCGFCGREVGTALSCALSAVMSGKIPNEKEDIITFLKKLKKL